ncbi:MAG: Gfo/Idh/MocA family protein [Fimbriimonadaceae bacterium]
MAFRVGILGVAHVHTPSYVASMRSHPAVELVGFHDPDPATACHFATQFALNAYGLDDLIGAADAVILSGTNVQHKPFGVAAASAGKHVLTEKPIATTLEDADAMIAAAERARVNLMTGFPCRFSPAWLRLKEHVAGGAVGRVLAVNATNRGTCPGGWFVEPEKSGGGAMIDHTVHVADLLRDLFAEEPSAVHAQLGNNVYGEAWEDTAMLTLDYASGLFATLDASWSRPKTFKTWGDVTMTVIGESGVLAMDMFGQEIEAYSLSEPYGTRGFGSNLDALMIDEFVTACREGRPPVVTGEHGRAALRVALLGYASSRSSETRHAPSAPAHRHT